MRLVICSQNENIEYTCRLSISYRYECVIVRPVLLMESFLKIFLILSCHCFNFSNAFVSLLMSLCWSKMWHCTFIHVACCCLLRGTCHKSEVSPFNIHYSLYSVNPPITMADVPQFPTVNPSEGSDSVVAASSKVAGTVDCDDSPPMSPPRPCHTPPIPWSRQNLRQTTHHHPWTLAQRRQKHLMQDLLRRRQLQELLGPMML